CVDGSEGAADVAALLHAFFIERALLIFLGIQERFTSACMTKKVDDHELSFPRDGRTVFRCRRGRKRTSWLALGQTDEEILRAESCGAGRRFAVTLAVHRLPGANVARIGEQDTCLPVVGQVRIENLTMDALAQQL